MDIESFVNYIGGTPSKDQLSHLKKICDNTFEENPGYFRKRKSLRSKILKLLSQ